MKMKIAVLTATRAEFGLLRPVIMKLKDAEDFEVKIVVTGAHLSPEFGYTYREILAAGLMIDRKIEILLDSDSPEAVSKSMGLAMISFSDYFEDAKPDALVVLGDRYETLAVSCAAMNARIPIVHLHGGEITEGAVDDGIRHAITKLSYLHMTSTEEHRRRVIQLGEQPDRVFNVGATGVENALHMDLLPLEKLSADLDFPLTEGGYAVMTFHPVTLENDTAEKQSEELLKALDAFPQMRFIVTKANADAGGRVINRKLEEYAKTHSNVRVYPSLGMTRYLSAVKYSAFVIGNSSSGIIEVPSFHVPTVNIGDRQKGRMSAESVINCSTDAKQIIAAIDLACSESFREKIRNCSNPYGDGRTSDRIVQHMKEMLIDQPINLKKKFFDIKGDS